MKIPAQNAYKVEEIRDESDMYGKHYFVYLRRGWQLDGAHCFGEETARDVRETLNRAKPCDCEECRIFSAFKERAAKDKDNGWSPL